MSPTAEWRRGGRETSKEIILDTLSIPHYPFGCGVFHYDWSREADQPQYSISANKSNDNIHQGDLPARCLVGVKLLPWFCWTKPICCKRFCSLKQCRSHVADTLDTRQLTDNIMSMKEWSCHGQYARLDGGGRNSVGEQFHYQLVALHRPFHALTFLSFILHPPFCKGMWGHGLDCLLSCADEGTVLFQSLLHDFHIPLMTNWKMSVLTRKWGVVVRKIADHRRCNDETLQALKFTKRLKYLWNSAQRPLSNDTILVLYLLLSFLWWLVAALDLAACLFRTPSAFFSLSFMVSCIWLMA